MKAQEIMRRMLGDLPVKVICITAAVILFLFNRINTLSERFFSVPLKVEVPAGLAVASAVPATVRITLRGEQQSINPVLEEDVTASMDLEAHAAAGTFSAPVKVSRTGTAAGVQPLEVRVEPSSVTVTLEPLLERRVTVVPDISGSPAHGYELAGYELVPRTVTIRGPRSRVEAVSTLVTEEVDLTGRTGPFTLRVRLVAADPLVRVSGDPLVEFRATIQEAVMARRFEQVPFAVVDMLATLRLREEPPPGSVQVQATQLAVEAVQPAQVRLLLELAGIRRPGVFTLKTRPEVPSSVSVLDWSPRELTVELMSLGR